MVSGYFTIATTCRTYGAPLGLKVSPSQTSEDCGTRPSQPRLQKPTSTHPPLFLHSPPSLSSLARKWARARGTPRNLVRLGLALRLQDTRPKITQMSAAVCTLDLSACTVGRLTPVTPATLPRLSAQLWPIRRPYFLITIFFSCCWCYTENQIFLAFEGR